MLTKTTSTTKILIFLGLLIAASLSACAGDKPVSTAPAAETALVTDTIPPQPAATITPTSVPLALRVNGQGIPLADYEAELKSLQAAATNLGLTQTPEEQRRLVIDELTEQALLAQAAFQSGFQLDEAQIDGKVSELAQSLGGEQALIEWQNQAGYTADSFRSALSRSIAAAWQRDQIVQSAPKATEQVKARQILVRTTQTAENLLQQIQAGADFATLAYQYDPLTGGDLGWFPRGYLLQPAVEEAAFALQPGQASGIIETDYGYHILFVEERNEQRPLSAEALLAYQEIALRSWLESNKAQSSIEVLIP